ncbi:unnamed protein product [Lathyrus sativus]|nr:unnamed protein product [Lathyrus sativus]
MGRKGSWFSSVRKIFVSDSKKDQKPHQPTKSKLGCFGHHEHYVDPELESREVVSVPSLPRRKTVVKQKKTNTEDERNKQALSLVLATAVATGAAVAAAQATRLATLPPCYIGKPAQEIAAMKIQCAFRGYLARRTLRGLRGLARLKALVKGKSVQRQAATTLQCMQTLSRLQSQVSARKVRMSEENQSFQRQLQQKREKELDKLQAAPIEEWDYSSKSKEQIEARLLQRQIAAMRREKALAYSSTHQQTWRNTPKESVDTTIMDPNNPHWGWNWLDRWMDSRPWEGQNTKDEKNHQSGKGAACNTMSVGEISKLYALRDQNQDSKKSHTSQKPSHQTLASIPIKGKAKKSSSGSWGGEGDSKSMLNKNSESNRRHSIAVSPGKEDEILVNSPTKVSKTKTKVQSTPAKKQLSLTASGAGSGTRRHSVPSKMGMNSNKNGVATIPEGKVKVRNGGSR